MNSLILLMVEKSIINSAPIFLAALATAFIVGSFLKNAGVGTYWRIVIYSLVGVGAGMWAYSAFDIPDRSFEVVEAITLGIAMFVYTSLVTGVIILIKNRKSKHDKTD